MGGRLKKRRGEQQQTNKDKKGGKDGPKMKGDKISKRLQIELQSLIAWACFDSDEFLQGGKLMSQPIQYKKLEKLYFPPNNPKDNRISFVDMSIQGLNVFEGLNGIEEDVDEKKNTICATLSIWKGFFCW